MASRAASGTSSTVMVGRSTLRPRMSGDCSPIWANTLLITGRRLMTIWSLLSSSSGRVALQHPHHLAVRRGDRGLPELGEGVGGHEGGDLIADEALDRPRQRDGEDLGAVGQGVLEDRLWVDELVQLLGEVGAERGLHARVVDELAGPVAEVVGLEEAPAGEHAEAGGQEEHAGQDHADDGEHAPDAALAPRPGVEDLDLVGQFVALGLQGLDVRRGVLGGSISVGLSSSLMLRTSGC